MSTEQTPSKNTTKTKKFGKDEREIPHHSQKAKKYYPAEEESRPKKACLFQIHKFTFFVKLYFSDSTSTWGEEFHQQSHARDQVALATSY